MASISYSIAIAMSEREDGSIYASSEALPGFHFILAPGEDHEKTLKSAISGFLSLTARLSNKTPSIRFSPNTNETLIAELEFV
jgi:hypothetical protein